MNAKKLSILFAVVVVIAAQLACAVGGEPSLSNMRSARDSDGNQPSTTFGAFDTVYVVGNLANGAAGNQVVSRWYAVNVPGYDRTTSSTKRKSMWRMTISTAPSTSILNRHQTAGPPVRTRLKFTSMAR